VALDVYGGFEQKLDCLMVDSIGPHVMFFDSVLQNRADLNWNLGFHFVCGVLVWRVDDSSLLKRFILWNRNFMLLMRICGLDSNESIVGRFGTSFLYPASWSWVEAALFFVVLL
jgi:hypothetical protein